MPSRPIPSSDATLRHRSRFALALTSILIAPVAAPANPAGETGADWAKVRPMLEQHCYDCHGGKKTKGGVDLKKLDGNPLIGKEFELWRKVLEAVKSGDMPPDDKPELAAGEKDQLLKWVHGSLDDTIRANAGDPGSVTMRRLTNAEYDHTVRDLTGIDYRFGKEFSPDGGGGEGFSNVGDVLFMSPQQLDKYFAAARQVADHATILPGSGITFEAQRVGLRGPVQLRSQAEQGLYVWYQKMAAPYLPKDGEDAHERDYLLACWKFKFRAQTGATSLEQLARESGLMLPFLENWWAVLNSTEPKSRYLDLTRGGWREMPAPDAAKPSEVPASVAEKVLAIETERRSWLGKGNSPGAGVQRHQQDADGIQRYDFHTPVQGRPYVHIVLSDVGYGNTAGDWVAFDGLTIQQGKKKQAYLDWLRARLNTDRQALAAANAGASADVVKPTPAVDPAKLQARVTEAETLLARFGKDPRRAEAKADAIVLQAPTVLTLPLPDDASQFFAGGKLDIDGPNADTAAVQWMATAEAPPDPHTVLPGILTVWKRQTPAANLSMREFNVMKNAFPDEFLRRMEEVARNYQRGGKGNGVYYLSDTQLVGLISPDEKARWERMMADWKLVRDKDVNTAQGKEWDEALKRHLAGFATRAWRRPLTPEESTQVAALYDAARSRDLDRESAGREVVVRLLVSPKFLFKLEDAEQPGVHHLTAWELATRLSYFLWASAPDEPLRAAAADGSLLQPDVLARETQRMLRDPRSAALGEEFAGQWLKFNSFVEKANIDATKFPEFTPELRRDMYRETTEFFTYLVREDRPVREIVGADYTFLNERLATFYGVPNVTGDEFRKVSVAPFQRGGVLGMGSLLVKNSYPHRTSPVLRGNWLLGAILGTPTPPPPNDVPKLDDSVSKATTLRTRLEAHRANKACSVCHDKIDPLGFALEGFDPIGRIRQTDEAGLAIDASGQWKDGTQFEGIAGLRQFLGAHDTEFTSNFCRKLVGYALGRSVLPTDLPLIETMRTALAQSDDRFSAAILTVTQSRQFQNRHDDPAPKTALTSP